MGTLTPFLKLYKPNTNEIGWDDEVNGNFTILDTFVAQFMSIPNFRGAWQNSQPYAVGEIALDISNGNFYRCLVAHTSAGPPSTFVQDRTARPTLWTIDNNAVQSYVDAAAASATSAANSATSATNTFNTFLKTYYGAFASDPLNDPLGGAKTPGDLYFNTSSQHLRVWTGTLWEEIAGNVPEAPLNTTTYGRLNGAWVSVMPTAGRKTITGPIDMRADLPTTTTVVPSTMYATDVSAFNYAYNLYRDNANAWRYALASGGSVHTGFTISEISDASLGGNGGALGISMGQEVGFTAGAAASLPNKLILDNLGSLRIQGQAQKPGGGTWNGLSDARVKDIHGSYTHGLAEILEMEPVLFTYKGNDNSIKSDGSMGEPMHSDTTTQYIGLIAQDCESYMPELVKLAEGYIDGVYQNDVRRLDATALIYALINAMKTIDARLTALEP